MGSYANLRNAIKNNCPADVERLLDEGADVETATPNDNFTVLMMAVELNSEAITRVLLGRGANPNVTNKYGVTALMFACWVAHVGRYEPLAKLLCSYGADRDAVANNGQTAISVARIKGRHDIADWLEATREWTPLHHLDILTPPRAAALLAAGANPHARATATTPSPFTLAKAMQQVEGGVAAGSAAAQVILEVEGWEAENSDLMPAEARSRGNELASTLVLWIGPRFAGGAEGMLRDPWKEVVIPRMLRCEYGVAPAFVYRS